MDPGRQRRLTRSARGWALSNRGRLGDDGETYEWEGMGDTLIFEVGHEAEFVENAGNEIGFGNITRPIQRTASTASTSTLTDSFLINKTQASYKPGFK